MPGLLFLAQRIPYPPNKGEKIRAWHMLQHLARSYEVHLGCLIDDPADWQHRTVLQDLCASTHFAALDRRRAKLLCLRGLLTGEPLSVTFYRDHGLAAWTRRVLDEVRPDVVLVFSSNMTPYVLDLERRERVRLIDFVDLDSAKWHDYAASGRPPMRWVHAREARLMEALERRAGRAADWCTFVSQEEADGFVALAPDCADRTRVFSMGVDAAYFDPGRAFPRPFDGPGPAFVFTGMMDYPPNIDAVAWFSREILPLIRNEAADAQFIIVGANPAREVQALAALPGVSVTGRVPDVRPYLAHAAAAVAPMRIARGIQSKVLEAMAMARPVVVTPQALTGIGATPGQELLLAETPAQLAAACLAATGPASAAIGAAARRRVMADYVWEAQLRTLDRLLDASAPVEAGG